MVVVCLCCDVAACKCGKKMARKELLAHSDSKACAAFAGPSKAASSDLTSPLGGKVDRGGAARLGTALALAANDDSAADLISSVQSKLSSADAGGSSKAADGGAGGLILVQCVNSKGQVRVRCRWGGRCVRW
jgi:hypothetical protein